MLIAHVEFQVAPADARLALSVLVAEVETVRAMPGCRWFAPIQDPLSPGRLGIVHEWETPEAFGRYLASPGFAEANARLRPLMTGAPDSRRFDAVIVAA